MTPQQPLLQADNSRPHPSLRATFSRREKEITQPSSSVRQPQDWQQRLPLFIPMNALQHLHRRIQTTATTGTAPSAHGQFGHVADAIGGSFADLAFSHAVADADVHGGSVPTGPSGLGAIPPGMRMIVNCFRFRCFDRIYVPSGFAGERAGHPRMSRGRAASAGPPVARPHAGRTAPDGPARGHRPCA